MTHEDTGKYALKHPPGTRPNEQIAKAIREIASGGELACAMGEKEREEGSELLLNFFLDK